MTAAVRLYVERARARRPGLRAHATRTPGGRKDREGPRRAAARDRAGRGARPGARRRGTIERLGEALSLLRRSAPDLPERQRSLRATIEWSVGCSILPHEKCCCDGRVPGRRDARGARGGRRRRRRRRHRARRPAGREPRPSDAASGEPRFGMLETIRAYAAVELERDEHADELRRRQLAWAIALADGGEPRYWTRGTPWLDRVEPELANVRAALDFARASGDVAGRVAPGGARCATSGVCAATGSRRRRRLEDVLARAAGVEARLVRGSGTRRP